MTSHRYEFGMRIEDILKFNDSLSTPWDKEQARSSNITIDPSSDILKKSKERNLDSTLVEVYASIVFSEILKAYSCKIPNHEFLLYSPKIFRFEYGSPKIFRFEYDAINKEKKSRMSTVYEPFCKGEPLNKVVNSKKLTYKINEEKVRVENRVMYLCGALSEILSKEGLIHGDPQLRHVILLPQQSAALMDIDEGYSIKHILTNNNGLGIIDCESARIEGPYSENAKKDADKFKGRVLKRFSVENQNSEEYFERGIALIKDDLKGLQFMQQVINRANRLFKELYTKDEKPIAEIDLTKDKTEKRVKYLY